MVAALGGDLSDESMQLSIDQLETVLGRPVVVQDTELRLIAHSKQSDDIDDPRRNVVLHRAGTPEFLRMCHALRLSSARSPTWIPELPEFGMLPRLCVPIRKGRTLLAYLFVLAPEGSLSAEQVATAVRTALIIATMLDAHRSQRRLAEQDDQLMLARLLGAGDEQTNLVATLTTTYGLPHNSQVIVSAFEPPPEPTHDDDLIDLALKIKDRLPPVGLPVHWMVHLGSRPSIVAVLAPTARMAETTFAELAQVGLRACFTTPVAIGTSGGPVPLAEIKHAYDRACVSAWVARTTGDGAGVRSWSEIGPWRLLARLAGWRVGDDLTTDLHPGLLQLIATDHGELISTLDAYLRTSGDVRLTAKELYLHRSTLYYRIDRIAEITGADLRDGETRYELTLGLRIAALLGLLPHTTLQPFVGKLPQSSDS